MESTMTANRDDDMTGLARPTIENLERGIPVGSAYGLPDEIRLRDDVEIREVWAGPGATLWTIAQLRDAAAVARRRQEQEDIDVRLDGAWDVHRTRVFMRDGKWLPAKRPAEWDGQVTSGGPSNPAYHALAR